MSPIKEFLKDDVHRAKVEFHSTLKHTHTHTHTISRRFVHKCSVVATDQFQRKKKEYNQIAGNYDSAISKVRGMEAKGHIDQTKLRLATEQRDQQKATYERVEVQFIPFSPSHRCVSSAADSRTAFNPSYHTNSLPVLRV